MISGAIRVAPETVLSVAAAGVLVVQAANAAAERGCGGIARRRYTDSITHFRQSRLKTEAHSRLRHPFYLGASHTAPLLTTHTAARLPEPLPPRRSFSPKTPSIPVQLFDDDFFRGQ